MFAVTRMSPLLFRATSLMHVPKAGRHVSGYQIFAAAQAKAGKSFDKVGAEWKKLSAQQRAGLVQQAKAKSKDDFGFKPSKTLARKLCTIMKRQEPPKYRQAFKKFIEAESGAAEYRELSLTSTYDLIRRKFLDKNGHLYMNKDQRFIENLDKLMTGKSGRKPVPKKGSSISPAIYNAKNKQALKNLRKKVTTASRRAL